MLVPEFGPPVVTSDVAQRERIPRKFLELILPELRCSGILHSRKSKWGGYFLAREPRGVSLGEILGVVRGLSAPIPSASKTAYMRCLLR
jgi:DNA-binding IscR family transcriptional regulator